MKLALKSKPRRLALATLFGVLIFVSKTAVPMPIDKAVVVLQALLLALGFLLLGSPGATYVALVGGLLTTLLRMPFAPFTILFALMYGLLVDGLSSIFRVKSSEVHIKAGRLVLSMTLSTALVGLLSYYTTVFALGLLQRNPMLEIIILVTGTISGALGGYLAVFLWRRNLQHLVRKAVPKSVTTSSRRSPQ